MIEGLRADRYDLIGSQVWANSSRAKQADFTVPLFYSGIGIYVRADDSRFDSDHAKIDSPDVIDERPSRRGCIFTGTSRAPRRCAWIMRMPSTSG